eukprot:3048633-Pleurochrysis_carterae.AAC.1
METRAATSEGVMRGGRWGSVKADIAAVDVPNAMMCLGELLGMAHVLAGNGVGGGVVALGLVKLADLAYGVGPTGFSRSPRACHFSMMSSPTSATRPR